VRYWLTRWMRRYGRPEALIVGCARGVDRQAIRWAYRNDIPVEKFVAQWTKVGKRAGRDRNKVMIDRVPRDSWIIAFPDVESRGTPHAIGYARTRGLHVFVCPPAWPDRSSLRPAREGSVSTSKVLVTLIGA
jgi:hypothetical protein